jgi:UDP-N-acetylmuramate--alanine ligase
MSLSPKLFRRVRRVHMIGIGGAGMCGIAEVLLNLGFEVSGSDLQISDVTERLRELGAEIHQGHSADNLVHADVVVFSSAVRPENVEVRRARDLRIPTIPRSEMLAELMRLKIGIAVAGTHGKTTVTSMIGTILKEADLKPTIIVGGKIRSLATGVLCGSGDILVVEADEFDRSFLKLTPTLAVITTIEAEHLDTYTDLEDIKDAFVEFANKVPFYGTVAVNGDDASVRSIAPRIKRQIVSFGLGADNDYRATRIRHRDGAVTFDLVNAAGESAEIHLQSPGEHNVLNALAATAIASELEIPIKTIAEALAKFSGVHRRFEVKKNTPELVVVDDYAHHPTEISQTLRTARICWPNRRLVVLFQPHLFSRTRDFTVEFAAALSIADIILLTDIFPSRERPMEGVTSDLIVQAAKQAAKSIIHHVSGADIVEPAKKLLNSGDVLVVMGAGSITKIADELANR